MAAEEHSHKKIGLYFGSFNPIHMGHLVIANHMATYTDLDEVWLVVTPKPSERGARNDPPSTPAADGYFGCFRK